MIRAEYQPPTSIPEVAPEPSIPDGPGAYPETPADPTLPEGNPAQDRRAA